MSCDLELFHPERTVFAKKKSQNFRGPIAVQFYAIGPDQGLGFFFGLGFRV